MENVIHNIWGFHKENPFDNMSLREGGTMTLGALSTLTFFVPLPFPFNLVVIGASFSPLASKELPSPGIFKALDKDTADKKVIPKLFEHCEAKIPTMEDETSESIKSFCRETEKCSILLDKAEKDQCEVECQREQRVRIQQACGSLRQIQNASARQTYLAKQIYMDTDPLSSCLFLANCRTSCHLSLGSTKVYFNVIEIVAQIFLLFAGDASQLQGLVKVANDVEELIDIAEKVKKAVETVEYFFTSLYSLISKVADVVNGVWNALGVIMNGALAHPLDWQTWKDFAENFANFMMEKINALMRIDEAGAKLASIADEVAEASGVGKTEPWLKLFKIVDGIKETIIEFSKPKISESYLLQKIKTDFKDNELQTIEQEIENLGDFANNNITGHQNEIKNRLEDIQEAVYNIRGIEPTSNIAQDWEVITGTYQSDLSYDAIGIYGVKLIWKAPPVKLGYLDSRFGFLIYFLDKIEKTKEAFMWMLEWLTSRTRAGVETGILKEIERFENRVDAYCEDGSGIDEACYEKCMYHDDDEGYASCVLGTLQPNPGATCQYGCEEQKEQCIMNNCIAQNFCECEDACKTYEPDGVTADGVPIRKYCYPDRDGTCVWSLLGDKTACIQICEADSDVCSGEIDEDCRDDCGDLFDECVDDDCEPCCLDECSEGGGGGTVCPGGGDLASCKGACDDSGELCDNESDACQNSCEDETFNDFDGKLNMIRRRDCGSSCWGLSGDSKTWGGFADAAGACRGYCFSECTESCRVQGANGGVYQTECCPANICSTACNIGEGQCEDDCEDDCEKDCDIAPPAGGGVNNICKAGFMAILNRMKQAAEKIKDDYIGEWGKGACDDVNPFRGDTGTCNEFSFADFFNIEEDNRLGAFLSDMRCFEELFLSNNNYCFFTDARMWLKILGRLANVDRELVNAKMFLSRLQPMLDVPPGDEMFKSFDFTNVFTTPFDYINEVVATIYRASIRAVDIIEGSDGNIGLIEPGKEFKPYLDGTNNSSLDVVSDLKELTEKYIGRVQEIGFTGLDNILQLIGTEQGRAALEDAALPPKAAIFSNMLEGSDDLDKIMIDADLIFNTYGVDTPFWYSDFIALVVELRKTQYGLRDALNGRVDISKAVQYYFDNKAKLEYLTIPDQPLFEMRAGLMAETVNTVIAEIVRLSGVIVVVLERFENIQYLATTLPNNPTNPFEGIDDLNDLANVPDTADSLCSDQCENISKVSPIYSYDACLELCVSDVVQPTIYKAARKIKNIEWDDLFTTIKTDITNLKTSTVKNELEQALVRIEEIIVDYIDEYYTHDLDSELKQELATQYGVNFSIKDILFEDVVKVLIGLRTPGKHGDARGEELIEKYDAIIELIKAGLITTPIFPAIFTEAESGSFVYIMMKTEGYVREIMKVLAWFIGIKGLYYNAYKQGGQIGGDYRLLAQAWDNVRKAGKEFQKILDDEAASSSDKFTTDGYGIKAEWDGVQCIPSAARGVNRTTGPTGGQVCPNVDRYTKEINSQFSLIRSSLKELEVIRRIPETKDLVRLKAGEEEMEFTEHSGASVSLKWSDLGVNFTTYRVKETSELNDIYRRASEIADESRELWGINIAIDFANQNCTCGWSYCKLPICISELPFTPQAITNAYCWIVYILRGLIWRKALNVESFLEKEYKDPEVDKDAWQGVVDEFVRERAAKPYNYSNFRRGLP